MQIEMLQALIVSSGILAPIVTGIVQAVKAAGLPVRFLPVAAVAIGAACGWAFILPSIWGAVAGLTVGLSAVGLFEFGKTTIAGK